MGLSASINDLKSTIGRRGGAARSNRFTVYFSHPLKKGGLLGGLPTTGFEIGGFVGNRARGLVNGSPVTLGGFISDPRDMALLCESTAIPGKSIMTQERYVDMRGVKRPYGFLQDEASFTFICTNDYYPYKYFESWMDQVITNKDGTFNVGYKKEYTTNVSIVQLGNTDFIPVHGIKLLNAYPIGITAVDLSNANENTVTRVTVSLAYEYYVAEGLVEGILNSAASTLVSNIGKLF